MKNELILSIIIPLYNSDKYISKCIDSFLYVESNMFEIVLVNDGSTDESENVCREYVKKDKRVRLICIENSGPGSARNIGIDNANGKYIFFCDSDDFINTKVFEKILIKLVEIDCDLCVFNKCYEGIDEKNYKEDYIGEIKDLEDVLYYTLNCRISAPWKKIYKNEIIKKHNIKFPINRILYEDLGHLFNYLKYTTKIHVFKDAFYYHSYNPNSLSRRTELSMLNDLRLVYNDFEELLEYKSIKKEVLNIFKNKILAILIGIIVRLKKKKINSKVIINKTEELNLNLIFDEIKPIDFKSAVRLIFYRTKLIYLYSMLVR